MNTAKTLIAVAFSFAAIGSAVAKEATSDAWMNIDSSKSRAQVQAELAQARADGSIRAFSAGYIPSVASSKTRAEVVAELSAARKSGELDRIHAEAWKVDGLIQGNADARVAIAR